MVERQYFTFLKSYAEIYHQLNNEQKVIFIDTIINHQLGELDLNTVSFDDPLLNIAFTGVKHNLEAAKTKYLNGKKPKRNLNKSKTEAKPKRNVSETEAKSEQIRNKKKEIRNKKEEVRSIKKEFLAKGFAEHTLDNLIEHRKMLKKPILTERMMSGLLSSLDKYADSWSITFDAAVDFYLSKSWISIDPEYKYTDRIVKNQQTQSMTASDIKRELIKAKENLVSFKRVGER